MTEMQNMSLVPVSPAEKKTIDTITNFVMVLLVIMGLIMEMDPLGIYKLSVTFYWWLVTTNKSYWNMSQNILQNYRQPFLMVLMVKR